MRLQHSARQFEARPKISLSWVFQRTLCRWAEIAHDFHTSDLAIWNESPSVFQTLPCKVRGSTGRTFSKNPSAGVSVDTNVQSETRDTAGLMRRLEQLAFTRTAFRPRESLGHLLSISSYRWSLAYLVWGVFGTFRWSVVYWYLAS